MNPQKLQAMYQSWSQDNDHYDTHWVDFVEMAARHFQLPESEILRELQKHYWFIKGK